MSSPDVVGKKASAEAIDADDAQISTMVLLIDDQPFIGEAVRRLLSEDPTIAVHFCVDPTVAVEIANRVAPTVILQDLVMPGIDGLELLARFRANPATAETPIIVLSSKEDARVKRDAFETGASDYLVKLPDRVELLARVRYHSRACVNQRRRAEIAAALRASQRALAERVAELQVALYEIGELQRSKTDFYSMVTHDLRNPAGNVVVAAKMLLQGKGGPLTSKQEQIVNITATAGEKLLRLITSYLDFAKIDAGYLRLELARADLNDVVRRAVAAAEPQAGVKRQNLEMHLPDVALFGVVDAIKLEQSLENLLSNAIKYTGDEGDIIVTLARTATRARITVRDSGTGIAPELLSSLFAKYHRIANEATRAAGGTGLGLLIAKEIIEGHGGTITASSTGVAGEGTSFTIDVPLEVS